MCKIEWIRHEDRTVWRYWGLAIGPRTNSQDSWTDEKARVARDFGLKGQIQDAAGSSMHNIAEGFDSETIPEFVRFFRYAKRSCTEVQSELYVALDQEYIIKAEFNDVYDHAGRTRAAIRCFIKYLLDYEQSQKKQK